MRFAVALAVVLPAVANAQPHAFKNLQLGAPQSEITADPRFECRRGTSALGDFMCHLKPSARESIAERPVRSVMLQFYDERLYTISVTIDSVDFRAVGDALTARYGAPSAQTTEPVTNRMGASFDNEIRRWHEQDSHIELKKYSGRIDRGVVHYRLNDFMDKFLDRKRQRSQGAAKDL